MRAPLPLELVYAIPLPLWRSLFGAFDVSPPPAGGELSHDAIERMLATVDLPLPFARAVFTVSAFSVEAARSDIYAAAHALEFPTDDFCLAPSPAALIAQLLVRSTSEEKARELLSAAKIIRDRAFRPRTTQIYFGGARKDDSIGPPARYVPQIRRETDTGGARLGFGPVRDVRTVHSPTRHEYEMIYEDRLTTVVSDGREEGGGAGFSTTTIRPMRSHRVVYSLAEDALLITTDALEAMTTLAEAFGLAYFRDRRHFLETPAVDLWKLQEEGADALSDPPFSQLESITAIGGTWQSGKHHAITPRGRDFFKALERYKIRIEGGRLDLVSLRAKVRCEDGLQASCDIALRPPHLLTISDPEHTELLHQFLAHAGIRKPKRRRRDFYSVQPWVLPAADWIALEGMKGFESLVRRGLLVADYSNLQVTPPNHPHAGRTASAFPLGQKFLAWSPDASIAPFVVSQDELVVYALMFGRVASVISKALGTDFAATELDDDGVLDCGRRVLGPTSVDVLLPTRPMRPATLARFANKALPGHAIYLMPRGRPQLPGMKSVAMPKLSGAWRPLLGAIARAVNVVDAIPTPLYAPKWARFVLHKPSGRAWLDGVLLLKLHETAFRLLECFIFHGDEPQHTKDLANFISRGRPTEDTTRRAIEGLVHVIDQSFRLVNKRPPRDYQKIVVSPKHAYYQLTARGFVD